MDSEETNGTDRYHLVIKKFEKKTSETKPIIHLSLLIKDEPFEFGSKRSLQ